jgi:BMFP domain-containing protein YqiC
MTNALERRLEALETRLIEREPVTIIRIVVMGDDKDAEPAAADVRGGQSVAREEGETAEAFLARVRSEASLAAKPGCVGVALVWPDMASRHG